MLTLGYQVAPMYGIIRYLADDPVSAEKLAEWIPQMLFSGTVTAVLHDENDPFQGVDVTIDGSDVMLVGASSQWILVDPFTNSVRDIPFPGPVFALRGVYEFGASDAHG